MAKFTAFVAVLVAAFGVFVLVAGILGLLPGN